MPTQTSSVIKTARRAASTRRVRLVTEVSSTPRIMRRWQPEQRLVLSTTWKRYLAIEQIRFGRTLRAGRGWLGDRSFQISAVNYFCIFIKFSRNKLKISGYYIRFLF